MDDIEKPPAQAPDCRFGPDRRLTVATVVAAPAVGILAVVTTDRAGQVLFALAAIVLLGYAVSDLVFWPRLLANADGIELRSPTGSARFPWASVASVAADTRQRLGLRSVTLEIDAGDELHVFSKRALGTQPERAAAQIRAMDPRR